MNANTFINDNFVLENQTAIELYHNYAKGLPIIDFHCHLSPELISKDYNFPDLGEMWLGGDHYKWRAMRINGVDEKYITGNSGFYDKFIKWAETVPYTIANPLYHWTHLELARYFNIYDLLSPKTADDIYNKTKELLKTSEFSTKSLIQNMNVEMIGTTDDPADSLEHHIKIKDSNFKTKVLPSFRADNILKTEDLDFLNSYIKKLGKVADIDITSFTTLIEALDMRHAFFHSLGARVSDSGPHRFYFSKYTTTELNNIFKKILQKKELTFEENEKYLTALMTELAAMNHKRGWVQQYHVGAIRNNNSNMMKKIGADTGFDSINNSINIEKASQFLNHLNNENILAKTILYNLNPADNEMFITLCGNFAEGGQISKVTYGAAWWFLDQKSGMERHLDNFSTLNLLSRFVGMVTDSRSFLSYPRHEYFRRIVCNYIGKEVEKGLIPDDEELLKNIIQGISYNNAKQYFKI